MKKKIFLLLLSIVLVLSILVQTTYSLLFKEYETEEQSYATGILEITSSKNSDSVTISNSLPMEDSKGKELTPYIFTITNVGNLAYQFDVKFLSTTTENMIDSKYIKIMVDDNEPITLSSLTDGVILEDLKLEPEESIEIQLRAWLDINTQNTEIGKVFNGKIVTEGFAINSGNTSLTAEDTLTYLRSLGFEGEVKTNTPDFTKANYHTKEEVTEIMTDYLVDDHNLICRDLETCMEQEYGMTIDEYYETFFNTIDDNGIYAKEDDQGTSYYFRGNVENNYVKFGKYTEDVYTIYDEETGTSSYASSCGEASVSNCRQIASAGDDMYWRIIRINGDGTVRMIYGGPSLNLGGIGRSTFNKNVGDNAYVGYMYGQTGASTYEATHENVNDSSVKTTIDRWYLKYLNTNYGSYIANAIYCNDRKVVTDDNKYKEYFADDAMLAGNGIGTSSTMYGTWNRINTNNSYLTEANPSLKCEQLNDRFTLQEKTIKTTDGKGGNQDLTYPIGLLTADEMISAGLIFIDNYIENYLYTGSNYWTNSPSAYYGYGATTAFITISQGNYCLELPVSDGYMYVYPVISLKADAIKSGKGTSGNPFIIYNSEAEATLTHLKSLGFEGTVSETEPTTLLTGATTDEGLFAKEDDQGTSYYFRGAVTNNYVKFGKYTEDAYANYDSMKGSNSYTNKCSSNCTQIGSAGDDMYWRIIRINGDGTIRMIYDGTSPHANNESSTNRQIGTSMFNYDSYDDYYNAYVGYMYGQTEASTYSDTHANIKDSAIKRTIDNWYLKYLNSSYGSYIANAIYCNDRSLDTTSTSYTGIGTTVTCYGAYQRLYRNNSTSVNPSLKCEQLNDRFTLQGEAIETTDGLGGNQDLTYPVGLITADETVLAGGSWNTNENYYLYTGNYYWTGSASIFNGDNALAFFVNSDGSSPNYLYVYNDVGARPTISIKPNAIKYGTGEATNPFRIEQ